MLQKFTLLSICISSDSFTISLWAGVTDKKPSKYVKCEKMMYFQETKCEKCEKSASAAVRAQEDTLAATHGANVSRPPPGCSLFSRLFISIWNAPFLLHTYSITQPPVCECVYVCVCTCVCLTQYKFRDPLHLQFSVMIICKSDTLKTLITSPYFKLEYCWYLIFFCKLAALLLPVKFMRRHFVLFFSVWKAMIRWKVAYEWKNNIFQYENFIPLEKIVICARATLHNSATTTPEPAPDWRSQIQHSMWLIQTEMRFKTKKWGKSYGWSSSLFAIIFFSLR